MVNKTPPLTSITSKVSLPGQLPEYPCYVWTTFDDAEVATFEAIQVVGFTALPLFTIAEDLGREKSIIPIKVVTWLKPKENEAVPPRYFFLGSPAQDVFQGVVLYVSGISLLQIRMICHFLQSEALRMMSSAPAPTVHNTGLFGPAGAPIIRRND